MAGLHVPLLTLRTQPYGWPRIARGQCGSLLLHCTTPSFAAPRRLSRRYSPGRPGGVLGITIRRRAIEQRCAGAAGTLPPAFVSSAGARLGECLAHLGQTQQLAP